MADWAQERLEDVWVPVGERLRLPPSLISAEECHAMLQRVRHLEHSLVATVKQKSHFVSFIAYISQLLELINERREEEHFKLRRVDIEGVIVTRALAILSSATFRFSDDLQLWATAVQFSIKNGRLRHVSKVLVQMLQYHSHNESMWVYAAKVEFERLDSIETARALFLQGLRKHPNSLLINKEYFKFELLAAELNRERSMTVEELLNSEDKINSPNEEQLRDAMTTSKVAAIVFENIKQSRPFDYDLIASCWEICQGFDFAKDLEKEIESYMREKFERKEQFWVAKIESALHSETIDEVKDVCDEAFLLCHDSLSIYGLLISAIMRKTASLTSKSLAMAYFKLCIEIFTQRMDLKLIDENTAVHVLQVLKLQDGQLCTKLVKQFLQENSDSIGGNVLFLECLLEMDSCEAQNEICQKVLNNEKLLNSVLFWTTVKDSLPKISQIENFSEIMSKFLYSSEITDKDCKIEIKNVTFKLTNSSEELSTSEKWQTLRKILSLPPVNFHLLQNILAEATWLSVSQTKWLFEHFSKLIGEESVEIWTEFKKFLLETGDVKQANLCNDRALRHLSKELVPQFLESIAAYE